MQRLITISCLAVFTALFLIASVDYFKHVAYPPQADAGSVFKVVLLAILAGGALVQFLFQVQIVRIGRWILRAALGGLVGVVLFGVIFFSEHVMSTIQLSKALRDPEAFSVVQGHCGIYSGRGLIRWYQLSLSPGLENRLQAFLFSNQCRIDHFLDLRRRQQLPCQADEDSLGCLSRWMITFSKRGYWNHPTRKMFFDEVRNGVISGREADTDKRWVNYALHDYELEQSHPTLIQQAGIEEDFNDLHHFYKIKDELDNLLLTKEVFSVAGRQLQDDRSSEAQKFREIQKEVNLKLEKIPELEEDVKNTRSKISYNPSP